jgi:hypothetical protein
VPELLKLLWDSTPRIANRAFACLSNFFMDFHQFWKVEAIINDLMHPLLHYLKSNSTFMQEAALEVVCSLGGIRNCLGPTVGPLIQACG